MKDLIVLTLVLLVAHHKPYTLNNPLTKLTEAFLEVSPREVTNKKVTHIEVSKKMDKVAYTIHLSKMVIDICTTPHEVLVVEVEVPMALPVIRNTTLIYLVVHMMVIKVHPVW